VQIFDTWAGVLPTAQFGRWISFSRGAGAYVACVLRDRVPIAQGLFLRIDDLRPIAVRAALDDRASHLAAVMPQVVLRLRTA
jgi:hypothetical protein